MTRKSRITLLVLLVATLVVGVSVRIARTQDMGGMDMGGDDMGSDESDTKTPPPALATGEWCGPMDDTTLGKSGGFFMDLSQKKRNLSGTWTTDISGFPGGKTGKFTGHIESNGTTVLLKLKQPHMNGGFMVTFTIVNDHNMTGSYTSFGRKTLDGGTLNPQSPCV